MSEFLLAISTETIVKIEIDVVALDLNFPLPSFSSRLYFTRYKDTSTSIKDMLKFLSFSFYFLFGFLIKIKNSVT